MCCIEGSSNLFQWVSLLSQCTRPQLKALCSDITEIRRCNQLEMPDNMNTFVLKVNHFPGSVIFETDNDQQLSSWTTEIKHCINAG
ncbi:SH2B adapter protein 3-like isoform X1 [Acipenser oxyrinchus oxyrinchus]|uniref:SH2B adapter protein 3-like isoform X1 n=1 Tax=Acipenser oxyrinchus oxyrinchus TaxID=40147 RepID=A0AAD8CYI3_ACIOX|nr:SH2B adapter protein 3-like isoform X1 [Acipenser oxyrinchus oxyrinchus]